MVWIEPGDLGWRPYVKTWLVGLHEDFTEDQRKMIWTLFDENVDECIKHYRKSCKEYIATVDINLISSLCSMFQALTLKEKVTAIEDPLGIELPNAVLREVG